MMAQGLLISRMTKIKLFAILLEITHPHGTIMSLTPATEKSTTKHLKALCKKRHFTKKHQQHRITKISEKHGVHSMKPSTNPNITHQFTHFSSRTFPSLMHSPSTLISPLHISLYVQFIKLMVVVTHAVLHFCLKNKYNLFVHIVRYHAPYVFRHLIYGKNVS